MSFLNGRSAKEAIEESILKSLLERDAKICSTWDRNAALSVAFAVKAELSQDEVEEVKNYVSDLKEELLLINDKVKATFIKGDVKERKDIALLIFRYKYMGGF